MGTYRSRNARGHPPRGGGSRLVLLLVLVAVSAVPAAAFAVSGLRHGGATTVRGSGTPGTGPAPAPVPPATPRPSTGPPAAPGTATGPPTTPATTGTGTAALFGTGPVRLSVAGFWSWALLDRSTGALYGYQLTGTSTTASMIKPWIAADYLSRTAERGAQPTASRLAELSTMIRDSDNAVAETVYRELGGDASIRRLVGRCALTETRPVSGYWSNTAISARDTVRMGACIADGRAAGPRWTGWLLEEMRQVRGFGGFGIRPQLPGGVAARTAIKNGWIERSTDGLWYVNCLAVLPDRWVLAVLTRYDGELGVGYGIGVCASVTRQLLAAPH